MSQSPAVCFLHFVVIGSVELSRCSWMVMMSILLQLQPAMICSSLWLMFARQRRGFESARVSTLSEAMVNAWTKGASLPEVGSGVWCRISPLWPHSFMTGSIPDSRLSVRVGSVLGSFGFAVMFCIRCSFSRKRKC